MMLGSITLTDYDTVWLHPMYNDKVSEIDEVPKLLNRLLDYQYTPLRRTDLPRRFKQDNLCRAELLDNFVDHSLLNYDCQIWLRGNWRLI